MITVTEECGKYVKTAIKLNNVTSVEEGWRYIDNYAKKFCESKGYDEYGIEEFYEDKAYASVVYFINGEIKGGLSFDISEFEKFEDFEVNKPYADFVYTKVRKVQPSHPVMHFKEIESLLIKRTGFVGYHPYRP